MVWEDRYIILVDREILTKAELELISHQSYWTRAESISLRLSILVPNERHHDPCGRPRSRRILSLKRTGACGSRRIHNDPGRFDFLLKDNFPWWLEVLRGRLALKSYLDLLLLFRVGALLASEVSEILVGKTSLDFRVIEILVVAHPASTSVARRIVVVSALLLLSSVLEIVALGVATGLVEAAFFLLKISTAITSVMSTLVSTVEVSTFVIVVATFPEATLVRVATV